METVLIVDDEVVIREYFAALFQSQGYRVYCAAGGHEALMLIQKNRGVSFLISDVQMPEGDGTWLLTEMQRLYPETPVILVTGESENKATELLLKGAWKVYFKPLEEETILSIISSLESFRHKRC